MPSKKYTHQETFDIVARALAAQGRPSRLEGVGCRYRGPDGTKCAAGHLIPDEAYTSKMEGCVLCASTWPQPADAVIEAEGHDLDLVCGLQACHDEALGDHEGPGPGTDATWRVAWADRMRRLAGKRGLSTAGLDEALAALAARAAGQAVSS